MNDFSNHPISITEAKAGRMEGGAGVWTPRDALISVLRDIDSGKLAATSIAIIVAEETDDGTTMQYYQRCNSSLELLGMYARAMDERR